MYQINPGREVKECPFCGSKANVFIGEKTVYGQTIIFSTVQCEQCKCGTQHTLSGTNLKCKDGWTTEYINLSKAINISIDNWNTRKAPVTDQSTQGQLNEQL